MPAKYQPNTSWINQLNTSWIPVKKIPVKNTSKKTSWIPVKINSIKKFILTVFLFICFHDHNLIYMRAGQSPIFQKFHDAPVGHTWDTHETP
jgi:hypothetical protein